MSDQATESSRLLAQDDGVGSAGALGHGASASRQVTRPTMDKYLSARDIRKGRRRRYRSSTNASDGSGEQQSSSSNIWRMLTVYPYWVVSWWIGVLFTIGCLLFVLTGALKVNIQLTPGANDGLKHFIAGIATCTGATMFAFAGVLLFVEAANEGQSGYFGAAVERTYDQAITASSSSDARDEDYVKAPGSGERSAASYTTSFRVQPLAGRQWAWWPSWQRLSTHYIYDFGFLGSYVLGLGTIIFWITGILTPARLPDNSEPPGPPALERTYWITFVVGGFHFAASGILYMLEVQHKWYLPNCRSMAWYIGLCNLIGGVGWILSAGFGFGDYDGEMLICTKVNCSWQSDLSLLWASVAFEIGSALLWYEAIEKYSGEIHE